jgi:uncharacterized protein YaaR (DUF327 family)
MELDELSVLQKKDDWLSAQSIEQVDKISELMKQLDEERNYQALLFYKQKTIRERIKKIKNGNYG